MAVGKATNVAQRRVVYGANAIIQIVLVILVAVGAVYVSQNKGQVDLTRTGVNSLSPRTEKLLDKLDEDVTITAIYTVLSEYDELAQKRQDAMSDLLKLYESAGHGHITANLIDPMKDRARLPALLKRLRDKPAYKDQAQVHAQALNDFPALNRRITGLIDEQMAEIERLLDAEPALQDSALVEIIQELNRLKRQADDVSAQVQELAGYDIPQYGAAVDAARGFLETVQRWVRAMDDWVKNRAPQDRGMTPDALALVERANQAYAELLPDISAFLERTRDLERVEVEQLSNQLNRWANAPPMLVETGEKAQVLSFSEAWPFRRDPNAPPAPDGDEREFAGEQAISSAILKLTQREKTAVVFVRYGGPSPIVPDFSRMNMMSMRQMPRAPYGVVNDLFRKENFITADWDVATRKTPPVVEDAARTVYLVFPPAPPPQPDPMRPSPQSAITPADVQAVVDAVQESGMGIFLTGASERALGGPGTYEFADYLKSTWGLEVLYDFLTIRFAPSPQNPALHRLRPQPTVIDTADGKTRFTDHPIVEPLRASTAGFSGVCPLRIVGGDEQPEGVTASELVVVEPSDDIWAIADIAQVEQDLRTKRGTSRREADLQPPFPIAVAAEKESATGEAAESTEEGESEADAAGPASSQRIVVFASPTFAANGMVERPGGYVLTGGGLVAFPAYPANPDLLINAIHWLTKEADRISVGARRTEVPRLDKLTEGFWMDFWRIFLVGIWPGLALVVGGGVWLFRRR